MDPDQDGTETRRIRRDPSSWPPQKGSAQSAGSSSRVRASSASLSSKKPAKWQRPRCSRRIHSICQPRCEELIFPASSHFNSTLRYSRAHPSRRRPSNPHWLGNNNVCIGRHALDFTAVGVGHTGQEINNAQRDASFSVFSRFRTTVCIFSSSAMGQSPQQQNSAA